MAARRSNHLAKSHPRGLLHQVFYMSYLPQAPENNIRVVSNFSENLRRYSQVTVHHHCTGINDTRGKFAAGVNDTGRKFAAGVDFINDTGSKFATGTSTFGVDTGGKLTPVSTTRVVNLPVVSNTQVTNNRNNIRLPILKVNLKKKMYQYFNSTTQRCPHKIFKTFLMRRNFLYATGVNNTGGAP
jgi:hypothetical protein